MLAFICRYSGAQVMVRIVSYRNYAPPALRCETIDSVGFKLHTLQLSR